MMRRVSGAVDFKRRQQALPRSPSALPRFRAYRRAAGFSFRTIVVRQSQRPAFASTSGRGFGGLLPTGKHQHCRMTAECARKHFRTLDTEADPIVFDRGQRSLRDTTQLSELILAEALEFANDPNGFTHRY